MTTSNIALHDPISSFWEKVPSHINFIEECVQLGHVNEFQTRYKMINNDVQELSRDLKVEFNIDMQSANVSALIITTNTKNDVVTKNLARKVVAQSPPALKDISTCFKLPALSWEHPVTTDWILGFCEQLKMPSVAPEMAKAIGNAEVRIKPNLQTNKVLIQFGLKNPREISAVGKDTIMVLMEMLLGEQVICECIENISIKTKRKLNGDHTQWLTIDALRMRDAILRLIY